MLPPPIQVHVFDIWCFSPAGCFTTMSDKGAARALGEQIRGPEPAIQGTWDPPEAACAKRNKRQK